MAERRANPTDFWIQLRLDLRPLIVEQAARSIWGGPEPTGTPGESMWRLWSLELDVPIYIAIGMLPPAILFSGGMLPEDKDEERLRDEVRQMLLDVVGP